MLKVAMGTGIGGAGPLSLDPAFTEDAIWAIDRARAAASGRATASSTCPASSADLFAEACNLPSALPPQSIAPDLAPLRDRVFVDFALAFTAFSLMARGTKPYLSMPCFVNIHAL
jgi:hypothetical protein